jgi:3,4-dihydroxy 2-butanone 4-phosphate synthase/GTP cyclohydrolase II
VIESRLSAAEEAVAEIAAGRMVVVWGDLPREGADLVLAAEFAGTAEVNFMAKEGRGLICVALTPERQRDLGLRLIPATGHPREVDAFTVSIEARVGVTTGISAADRARTIRTATDPSSGAGDLRRPGHVFPVVVRPGGVLERAGRAECSVDLARLAGLRPVAVKCEILTSDGRVADRGELAHYCAQHRLKMVSVADLVEYRLARPGDDERAAPAAAPAGLP